jgi:hypothetical protein
MSHGVPVLVKLPEIDFIDDKAGKPVGNQKHIGRRPIAAFGNSDGDLQMLEWTCSGCGAYFCLCVITPTLSLNGLMIRSRALVAPPKASTRLQRRAGRSLI